MILFLLSLGLIWYFVYYRGRKPNMFKRRNNDILLTMDDKYNTSRSNVRKEYNRILDKIKKRGIKSLTQKERDYLHENSDKI